MFKRLSVPLLILLVLAGMVIFFIRTRPRQLMDSACKVLGASSWNHLTLARSYLWLSNHTLLFSDASPQDPRFGRYELETKQTVWLDALTQRIKGATGDKTEMMASPDGRWLLWTVDNSYRHAATLDGTQFLTWDTGYQWNSELPCWMPDSRHWIEFSEDPLTATANEARIYDVTSPTSVQAVPLEIPTRQDQQIVAAGSLHRLIVMSAHEEGQDILHDPILLSYPLNVHIEKATPILLPPTGKQAREDLAVSPNGDRIAWTVQRDYPPSRLALFLHRYLKHISTDTLYTQEIWITPTEGGGGYLLGYIPLQDTYSGKISDLQWLPDSRQLSFVHNNVLYTLSAD